MKPIPVISLFAGAGALDEGFASLRIARGEPVFDIRLSVEDERAACRTLILRVLFRRLASRYSAVPQVYYRYLRQEVTWDELLEDPAVAPLAAEAAARVRRAFFGSLSLGDMEDLMHEALAGSGEWVLLGSPPCQPYQDIFSSQPAPGRDHCHPLFRQYLEFIGRHRPSAFLFENVVGVLRSPHALKRLYGDLSQPASGVSYFVRPLQSDFLHRAPDEGAFTIEAADFGVPQRRRRVMFLAIRNDLAGEDGTGLIPRAGKIFCRTVLDDLPKLRSPVAGEGDSFEKWHSVLSQLPLKLRDWDSPCQGTVRQYVDEALSCAVQVRPTGGKFIAVAPALGSEMPADLAGWLLDPRVGGTTQHLARASLATDLQRFLFASSYTAAFARTPSNEAYPPALAFKALAGTYSVQAGTGPASAVSPFIAKDGRAYIHYDPPQSRSLTVREAARLQTYPDNFWFEGNLSEQYRQVASGVPPFLARQIAEIVGRVTGLAAPGPG